MSSRVKGPCSKSDVKIGGVIRVDGKIIDPVKNRKNIAYVMQEDCLLKTETPREALTFSASLRLPKTTSLKEIEHVVDSMLDNLGLTGCADTQIGDELKRGISGGEKKRTSIGCELVSNPNLVFLDEPTSGLDSFASYRVVELLKKVSATSTVLCTIHQP